MFCNRRKRKKWEIAQKKQKQEEETNIRNDEKATNFIQLISYLLTKDSDPIL